VQTLACQTSFRLRPFPLVFCPGPSLDSSDAQISGAKIGESRSDVALTLLASTPDFPNGTFAEIQDASRIVLGVIAGIVGGTLGPVKLDTAQVTGDSYVDKRTTGADPPLRTRAVNAKGKESGPSRVVRATVLSP